MLLGFLNANWRGRGAGRGVSGSARTKQPMDPQEGKHLCGMYVCVCVCVGGGGGAGCTCATSFFQRQLEGRGVRGGG